MTVHHVARTDSDHVVTMTGFVHRFTVMTTGSDYDPVMVQIERGGDTMTALLDQDDIDALAVYFAEHATPTEESR